MGAISNKKLQEKLDKEKWLLSEKLGYDKAGGMDWCTHCEFTDYADNKNGGVCTYLECKKNLYPCAKAYNRMKKKVNKN